jgi:integrase
MARLTQRLNSLQVQQLKDRGWYPDGQGLYLQISATGSKSWVFRFTREGKQRWHGLGAFSAMHSLKDARLAAEHCRQQLRQDIDPIEHKQAIKQERRLAEASRVNFESCAHMYIDRHKHGWKNQKHLTQWQNTLQTYAYPVIGGLPIQVIDVQQVLQIVEPIWHTKTETANRVRQRIELVLDWATAMGFREGVNPARWRGHMEKLLPKPSRVKPVEHHSALQYSEVPELFTALSELDTTASRLLQATALTAARSSEMRLAEWSEIDLDQAVWEVPLERMKSRRPHRVPLSTELVELLQGLNQSSRFVFSNSNGQKPLSEAAVRKLLKSMVPDVTLHGFRSTFRDWCAEQTDFQRELAEKALSHSLSSQVEAAYQRGDMFEKRRTLMTAWSDYCYSNQRKPRLSVVASQRRGHQ